MSGVVVPVRPTPLDEQSEEQLRRYVRDDFRSVRDSEDPEAKQQYFRDEDEWLRDAVVRDALDVLEDDD